MIRVRQIKVAIEEDNIEVLKKQVAKKIKKKIQDIKQLKIVKKSLDARKKPELFYIYEVDIDILEETKFLKKNANTDIFISPKEEYCFPDCGKEKMRARPIIVGSGPSGLFCAYELALHGYNPLIIERGEKIENRIKSVNNFWQNGILNPESNVQFGEGGAGTFSDGKLNTMVKDKFFRGKRVLEIFVENGAPEEILYMQKPHIGTDLLRNIIINIRKKIEKLGGEFLYSTKLTDLKIEDSKLKEIQINDQEWITCETLVLALGHSARDTFEMLLEKGLSIKPKPFAVGIRIEHPQKMIDASQYGEKNVGSLPPASYKLTYTTRKGRGVYSFCMCPGGYVVNASSEERMLAINGMSESKRDTYNANAAIVVTVSPKDFGECALDGLSFQRNLEKKAYTYGKGKIPIQLYKDFQNHQVSTSFGNFKTITKGNTIFADLNEILPEDITNALKEAIPFFATKINGFDREDAILLGVETRTSSPIRMERNDYLESNIKGIMPCGEGAGYAGGITSAAMDGLKCAEEIAKKFSGYKIIF